MSIRKKFIGNSQVDETKISLNNNGYLKAKNFQGNGDVNIIKVNANDTPEFAIQPVYDGKLLLTEDDLDLADYLKRDGSTPMMGNLDMDDYSIENVGAIGGGDNDGLNIYTGDRIGHTADSASVTITTGSVDAEFSRGNIEMEARSIIADADEMIALTGGTGISATANGNIGITANGTDPNGIFDGKIELEPGLFKAQVREAGQSTSLSLADNLIFESTSTSSVFDLNNHKIQNLADPTAGMDATNKDYVDFQDALKVSKTGDSMTGDLVMNDNRIKSLATPVDAGDAVNKAYADALAAGAVWLDPVIDPDLVNDSLTAPPMSTDYEVYIVASPATGAWAGMEGRAVYYNGTMWVDLLGRVVEAGDRFGVSTETSIAGAGGLFGKDNQIAEVMAINPTTYAITWAFTTPMHNQAFYVSYQTSTHFGHSYHFNGTSWVEFGGPGATNAGTGLYWSGNTLNVNLGAGISELPTDEVGVDVYPAGALELVNPDDGTGSMATNAQLSVKLDGTTLSKSFSGIKVAFGGITDDEISNTAAIKFSKMEALTANKILSSDGFGVVTSSTYSFADVMLTDGTNSMASELNMGNHKIINVMDPVNPQDAATKFYVDQYVGNIDLTAYLKHDGTVPMSGNLNMDNHKIVNLMDPTLAQDAATKFYVDSAIEAIPMVDLTPYFKKDGSEPMMGDIDMDHAYKVKNMANPTDDQDAATKYYVDTMVAEIDLTEYLRHDGTVPMSGDLNLNNHKITNLMDATNPQDAVAYHQVADALVPYFKKDGSEPMMGDIDMDGYAIKNLMEPVDDQDAATKFYVDAQDAAAKMYVDAQDAAISARVTVLERDPVTKFYVDTEVAGLTARADYAQAAIEQEKTQRMEADTEIKQTLDLQINGVRVNISSIEETVTSILQTLADRVQQYQRIVLSATDITNGYIEVGNAIIGTPQLFIFEDRLSLLPTDDYTVSGKRIIWNPATVGNGGINALSAGDVIHVYYFKG